MNDSYVFCLARRNKSCDVYQCTGCKKMGLWKTVKVVGDDFMVDPCSLGHECTPKEFRRDKGNRIAYSVSSIIIYFALRTVVNLFQVVNDIRANPMYAGRPPRQVFEQKLDVSKLLYGEDTAMGLYASGYEQRRQAISRAINSLNDRVVTLENIPEEFSFLSDGTRFVQEQDPEVHIYYSERTIEKACTNGLFALVADGVHTKQPKSLTQLYCVHGVCDGGVEVQLLYALTARKTEGTYRRIFGYLQAILERYRPRPHQRLRVVLDFEKASINAAKSVCTHSIVQGCAFHLSQAWNRRRDSCGLRKFIQGPTKVESVEKWWDTIKGVIFFPTHLRSHVEVLFKLDTSFSTDHPDVRSLLEKLRTFDFEARCALQLLENNPEHCKRLRKRDIERGEKVEESMTRFATLYRNRGATRTDIEKYCRNMSRFISGKTV
ncbi:hypothetical protein ANCCAN_24130 [Ancylostoma caninum]|uniref:MULE transposase domain-containing protein n=1 Tax=Ancylostoma caninum TaxID=29170 RepID=A0A368FD97_ANCCA|nr:hypothetical protein ANCCAN_24130 [Ancylostoma caninum]